jgi:hypothetical protein
MKLSKLIISAATGTTFMTLFSHIIAEVEAENFSEPHLLASLAHRLLPGANQKATRLLGWGAHYFVGALFAAPYQYYLNHQHKKPTLINSLTAGAIGGVAGIAMWKATFKAHPIPPRIPYNKFYTQLFFAHLVFGLAAGATLHLLEQSENKHQTAGKDSNVLRLT